MPSYIPISQAPGPHTKAMLCCQIMSRGFYSELIVLVGEPSMGLVHHLCIHSSCISGEEYALLLVTIWFPSSTSAAERGMWLALSLMEQLVSDEGREAEGWSHGCKVKSRRLGAGAEEGTEGIEAEGWSSWFTMKALRLRVGTVEVK